MASTTVIGVGGEQTPVESVTVVSAARREGSGAMHHIITRYRIAPVNRAIIVDVPKGFTPERGGKMTLWFGPDDQIAFDYSPAHP